VAAGPTLTLFTSRTHPEGRREFHDPLRNTILKSTHSSY
jgi:hypothetical protein